MGHPKLLSTVLALAVAGGPAAASGQTGDPKATYLVGAILSVTGPETPFGTRQRDVLLMVRDAINKQGGINGHPLQLVIEDDASDKTMAVRAAKKSGTRSGPASSSTPASTRRASMRPRTDPAPPRRTMR